MLLILATEQNQSCYSGQVCIQKHKCSICKHTEKPVREKPHKHRFQTANYPSWLDFLLPLKPCQLTYTAISQWLLELLTWALWDVSAGLSQNTQQVYLYGETQGPKHFLAALVIISSSLTRKYLLKEITALSRRLAMVRTFSSSFVMLQRPYL